jgi:CRP-like cAMP-binding protein
MAEMTFGNQHVKKGTTIASPGQRLGYFFLIREGQIFINRALKNTQHEDDKLRPGDFFGVEEALTGHQYVDTVVAQSDCLITTIQKEQYNQLIQSNTAIARKIALNLSIRLRMLNQLFSPAPPEKKDDNGTTLYKTGDYYFTNKQKNQAYRAWSKYIEMYPNGAFTAMAQKDIAAMKDKVALPVRKGSDESVLWTYPEGTVLCVEGEVSSELFLIQKGRVKVSKLFDNKEVVLSIMDAGAMLGEMALLESKPRSATITALVDSEIVVLTSDRFEKSIHEAPQVVNRLCTLLAERIWYIAQTLKNRRIEDPAARCNDMLAIQLEKEHIIVNLQPHTFGFSGAELCEMAGITDPKLVAQAERQLISENFVGVADNKIVVNNKLELTRRAALYWKMHPLR